MLCRSLIIAGLLAILLAALGCAGEQASESARVDAVGTMEGGAASQPRASSPPPALAGDLLEQPSGIGDLTLAQAREAVSKGETTRRELVKRLLPATDADAPALHKWLHRQVDTPAADMKNVLRAVGAAVPDSKGRFTQPAQKRDLDWLEALLNHDAKKLSVPLKAALNECLLTVALLRATAAAAHPDASVSLVRFGYRHLGAFRDECGRQIRAMGVAAVPGLVRIRNLKDELGFKMVPDLVREQHGCVGFQQIPFFWGRLYPIAFLPQFANILPYGRPAYVHLPA